MPTISFSTDEAAAQILRESGLWQPNPGTPLTFSYAYRATANPPAPPPGLGAWIGGLPAGTGSFTQFRSAQIEVMEYAIAMIESVANVTFNRVGTGTSGQAAYSDSADILFGNYGSGPNATNGTAGLGFWQWYTPDKVTYYRAGKAFFNANDASAFSPSLSNFGLELFMHELMHTITLSHPGDYDITDGLPFSYANDAPYIEDARLYTVMSYFSASNVGANWRGASAMTPMMHDIAALQYLFGANTSTRSGDTVYGWNSNTALESFTFTSETSPRVFTIWDAGGIDTLDLSGFSSPSSINLNAETFSSAGLNGAGLSLEKNIAIARGVIVENAIGGGGADNIIGNAANNTLNGGGGADTIDGGAGADTLIGGGGDDVFFIDNSGDVVVELGGGGTDWVTSSTSLLTLINFANVENWQYTGAAEFLLIATDVANVLGGGSGHDTVFAGGGDDQITTGEGHDGVIAGDGADTVFLSEGADYAYGGEGADQLYGDAGEDILIGEGGGDYISGGGDQDYIFGNAGDDELEGGDGVDVLIGDIGADLIGGGGGNDYIYAGADNDTANGGDGADLFVMEGGDDVVNGDAGDDFVYGGEGADTINGGDGTDILLGQGGDDTLSGGLGIDYVFMGDGADQFAIDRNAAGLNVTVLYEFTPGAGSGDTLRLLNTGWSDIEQVRANTFDTGNGYSIIVLDGDTQIWVIGLTPDQLVAGDALFS